MTDKAKFLKKIVIENYKSIKSSIIELKEFNVMVGMNGSGKSNLLSVFKLLNNLSRKKLQTFSIKSGGASQVFYKGKESKHKMSLFLDFHPNTYEAEFEATGADDIFFTKESCSFQSVDHENPYKKYMGNGHKETNLIEEDKLHYQILQYFRTFQVYHFYDTSSTSPIKDKQKVDDNKIFHYHGHNLAPFLYFLQESHPKIMKKILSYIQMIAPYIESFLLQPDRISKNAIQLEWQEKNVEGYRNANSLSEGTLRMLCILALIYQPHPPHIFLLEEPEIGLHPNAICALVEHLKNISKKNQVIVATQSVTFLNYCDPEDIIVVKRSSNNNSSKGTEFLRLANEDFESWLEDYSVGTLWEKNVFGDIL